ncbi:hypothetical protein [Xanthomonas oryzae]|uniref:hypothetical protein n=1 Tax=Xanthomonas oryzae TaxID=347 RepID=UPI0013EF963A|nr:hypothetical protein [Xanthomonas oryzae]
MGVIVTVCAAAWPASSTAIAQVSARYIDKDFFMGFSAKGMPTASRHRRPTDYRLRRRQLNCCGVALLSS